MMDTTRSDIPLAVPSNKFYPPHIDKSQSLLRSTLLDTKLPKQISAKKAVIIEAQAGQGKTTLISQFLEYNNFNFVWYQIGPEDSDPVLLLSSLLADLTTNFPEFSSPQLTAILSEGSVGPLDLQRCANILLRDIDSFFDHDLFIVFDDLHLVAPSKLSCNLLEYLLDTSPPRLRFVLSSRHPLELKSKILRDGNRISYLSTHDLALNESEIETLYNSVLNTSITHQDAIDIYRVTNGWIMGIVLASHPISGRGRFWEQSGADLAAKPGDSRGHMLDYFQDEIFDKIPVTLHAPFLKLSLLAEIPVDLADTLTGMDDFGDILSVMARDNFFVYRLDDNRTVFRFHHFFQEFLQLQAKKTFTPQELTEIHTSEADYYLERGLVEKGLACYCRAGRFDTMDQLLKTRGLELIAKNRTLTILSLLDSIPEETLFKYSWLTLYSGLLRNDFTPQITLPFYQKAMEIFIADNDETGELIALSQMLYFHFVISGLYNIGSKLLPRTSALYEKNRSSLPAPVKILAARNLASGYCFFDAEMDRARSYIREAAQLSASLGSKNFIASSHFIKGYIELLSGNQSRFLQEAEICYSLLNDPLVGMSNKLTLRVMYLGYLSMIGDFHNFNIQQQTLRDSIDQRVVEQTVAAPYLYVWGAVCYFSMGKTELAMELLNKGLGVTSTAATGHMHSQLLQWLAYGSALTGDKRRAISLISESEQLRHQAGGPFYTAFHHIMAGGVYTRTGDFSQAEQALDIGVDLARAIPSVFLEICGLMHRSFFHSVTDNTERCLDDLESGLSLMAENGYDHFWGWEPQMMARLLAIAAAQNIQREFAGLLSRKRLIVNPGKNGDMQPLIRITLLDQFEVSLGQQVICRSKDLTPSQRELLGLLFTAKDQRISQERVQLELWPDSNPENARKSFDTLLTRVRKEMTKNGRFKVKHHLYMKKGILCLDNYSLDSELFLEKVKSGLAHCKKEDWWQAGNSFNHALLYWCDVLPEETFKSEQALNYNDHLVNRLVLFALSWGAHLATTGNTEKAAELLGSALKASQLDERLVTLLYALHVKNKAPLKARETLERYRNTLEKIGYGPAEIEEYLAGITHSAKTLL